MKDSGEHSDQTSHKESDYDDDSDYSEHSLSHNVAKKPKLIDTGEAKLVTTEKHRFREKKAKRIAAHIRDGIKSELKHGNAMYVTGWPGVGKTVVVNEVIGYLKLVESLDFYTLRLNGARDSFTTG